MDSARNTSRHLFIAAFVATCVIGIAFIGRLPEQPPKPLPEKLSFTAPGQDHNSTRLSNTAPTALEESPSFAAISAPSRRTQRKNHCLNATAAFKVGIIAKYEKDAACRRSD